jgi:hypothetical protein
VNIRSQILVAAVVGQLVGLLGWIDPIFIPLALAGPLVVGAVAAARRVPVVLVAVLWFSAGLNMMVMDWLITGEDVVFHLVLGVVMAGLAVLGHAVVSVVARRREGGRESTPVAG